MGGHVKSLEYVSACVGVPMSEEGGVRFLPIGVLGRVRPRLLYTTHVSFGALGLGAELVRPANETALHLHEVGVADGEGRR